MYIWHKETTPGTTGARCTIRDGSGLFVAECIASDAAAIVEAPAMLAALRASVACLRGFHASPDFGPLDDEAIDAANTILARIDGTPTDEAAADSFAAHALDTLKDCEAWFANGGDVGGVFFDDATMLDRVRESLALATPTAQPAPPTTAALSRFVMQDYRTLANLLRDLVEAQSLGSIGCADLDWIENKLLYLEAHDPEAIEGGETAETVRRSYQGGGR